MRIAGDADHQALVVEGAVHRLVGARARRAGRGARSMPAVRPTVRMSSTPGRSLSAIAASANSGSSLRARSNRPSSRYRSSVAEARGAGERMRRIGVAVEQFDGWSGPLHEGVVHGPPRDHAAHRHAARGDAFGEGDDVGRHAVALGRERVAEPAEAGNHLVEDQQNAVVVADRAQSLQIALGRRQHAGRTGHRLDDDGRDGRGVMQRDDALEIVGEMRAPFAARPW